MKVSIITINLNNADGLENTIKSVLSQTFLDYEYIIIDGNSNDNSVEVIKHYSDKITYWVSEKDKGIYNAMNKGIAKVKGEYLLFLNSGDCLNNSDTLNDVFSQTRKCDFLFGNIIFDYKNRQVKRRLPSEITFYYLYTNSVFHQATFIKKSVFDSVGLYDEGLKIVSDWKFVLEALIKADKTYEIIDYYISLVDPTGISVVEEYRHLNLKERNMVIKNCFPLLYEDYAAYKKVKRLSFSNIIRHIKDKMLFCR
ncbi:MAG: glycosyltransferase family 2 protein [Bacteroidales bacterium]|nr:glycosyltransferase family 2 protein [Bacteroidales bacterium]